MVTEIQLSDHFDFTIKVYGYIFTSSGKRLCWLACLVQIICKFKINIILEHQKMNQ